jgi:hypothetical protein
VVKQTQNLKKKSQKNLSKVQTKLVLVEEVVLVTVKTKLALLVENNIKK